ncbi:Tubulin polyglutamylase TTLL5 [Hondaea fermentalgiana]|uniref:Tubulin polyglutamylase TTLL5 n=1 Tax=Hondaea fermentalgiana TaxID=2315210 RepID=A0A2R5FZP4_9STRA|nr:Tubulin polyglutamylase TTLL5 [Hondaea fermentalgiana]|eukprot:GBG24232.1 Tubulin polyglutamylase TTLL5 [Hondaea fermentalgiana]
MGSSDLPLKKEKKSKSKSSSKRKSSKKKSEKKGKRGPAWKIQLETIFMQAKVRLFELQAKMESNPEFRQRVMTFAIGTVTVLLLLAVMLKNGGAAGHGAAAGGASGGSLMSLTKSSSSLKGSSHATVSSKPPGILGMTKREREKAEMNFDVSGSDLMSVKRRYGTREEHEAAQKTGHKQLSAKEQACYKNMPVQVVRDSPKVGVYKPRKVFDLAVLQAAQKNLGFVEESDMKKATLILKGVPRVVFRQLKEGKQYYDMVASLGRIGSKKKTQLATLRNHVRKFKCSFESLYIQPRSYDMNKPTDCNNFFKNPDKGRMWVLKSCKSGEGSKGMGISVIDDLGPSRQEFGACEANAMNYVAQAYIEHPLLLDQRKFDMRMYLFVASTKPYIVFANPGYIRRSLALYKPSSTEKNDVLTNYHVQMERNDFKPSDAMWNFPQFIEYLRSNDHCVACGDIEIQLFKIARLVFDSGRSYYKRWSGSFQLVGLDFMMDAYLNVMFIEGNVSPGIGNHGLAWKRKMMLDLVQIMYEQTMLIHEKPSEFDLRIGDRVYGPNNNYFELVVNEHHEKCNSAAKFNPCKELKPEGVPDVPEEEVADDGADPGPDGDDDEED